MRRLLPKADFNGLAMVIQSVGGLVPIQRSHRFQTAIPKQIQHTLHRGPTDARQHGNPGMGFALGFLPQDFHATLHMGIGMLKAFAFDGLQLFRGKLKGSHPCLPKEKIKFFVKPPRLTTQDSLKDAEKHNPPNVSTLANGGIYFATSWGIRLCATGSASATNDEDVT